MKIRMYPIESAPLVDGTRVARSATKAEVLAYFSHPAADLEDADYWLHTTVNQRRQLEYAFTSDELEGVHPDHRKLFIDHATWLAETQPSPGPQQVHLSQP